MCVYSVPYNFPNQVSPATTSCGMISSTWKKKKLVYFVSDPQQPMPSGGILVTMWLIEFDMSVISHRTDDLFFTPRLVLVFGYCHCPRLYLCLSMRVCQSLFIRPFEKRTYYAMAMSVRLSVRPSFPDFFSTCFEISIWHLVYAFSRWHDMSSLSFITIGSLWPSLQPKVGQTQFLQSWPYKSR